MKRFAIFLLLGAFVLPHLALAEDDEKPRTVSDKLNPAAQQRVARARWQAQQRSNQAPQNVQRGPQTNQNVNRVPVQPQITTNQTAVDRNNSARVNYWRGRQNWTSNRVVQPNVEVDSSTSANDWQNRSGNDSEWNRRRWSNRHNWDRRHRHRSWWRSNYTRFALFGGGYYYWNNGWWYPAYGYDPYFSTYAYDAPIYAYQNQDPGQVIANVQAALNRRGFDAGPVDGSFGPQTRRALIYFQRENGLPVTGQIDEATLSELGFY